jgi:hypothetical protein
MPAPQPVNKYYRGQGSLYIRDASLATNSYFNVGNVKELLVQTVENYTNHSETATGEKRIDLRIKTTTEVTSTITLESTRKENWAVALKAGLSAVAGATVSAEAITAPAVGNYFSLKNKNITSITSITSSPAGTTYVAGTDYIVSPLSGMIYVPAASALAGLPILANYVAGAVDVISAFGATAKNYYLYFDGLNTVDSKVPVVVELFKVQFDSLAVLSLISDNLTEFQMKANALYDATYDTIAVPAGGFFRVTQTQ